MGLSAGIGFRLFEELSIVGYAADVKLCETPRIVPPIFGFTKVDGLYLYPPFDYVNDQHGVRGGTPIEESQLLVLRQKGQATLFLKTLSAKPSHLLVRREGGVWYAPKTNVLSWMVAYSEKKAVMAYRYFVAKETGNASYFAKLALNADDSNLSAMEVLGAVYWIRRLYKKAHPLIKEAREIDEEIDLKQRIKRLIHERNGTREQLSVSQERMLKRLFGRRIPTQQFRKRTLKALERRGLVEVIDKIAGLSWLGEERMKPDPKHLEKFE